MTAWRPPVPAVPAVPGLLPADLGTTNHHDCNWLYILIILAKSSSAIQRPTQTRLLDPPRDPRRPDLLLQRLHHLLDFPAEVGFWSPEKKGKNMKKQYITNDTPMIPYVNQQCWVIAWLLSKLSEGFMDLDKYDKGPIHHDPFDTISTAWAMIVPTSTMGQSSSLLLSESCRQNMAGHEAGDYSGTWAWLQEPWNGGSPTESSNVGLLNPLKSIDTDCSSILGFPLRHYALNKFAALISVRHVLLLVVCVLCICLHGFPVPQGLRFIACHPSIRNAWCPGKQRPSEAFPFLNTWEYLRILGNWNIVLFCARAWFSSLTFV